MAIDINRTNNNTGGGDPSNWMYFCEQGVCYQHQNGNLTYAQCKMNCAPHPCSMFAEACADANAVWNGTSPYTMQQIVQHWVDMFALPQMGGHSFTHAELGNYLLKCCYDPPIPRPPHSPRAKILNRPVRENFYNIPTLNNKVKDWESVLGGVVAPKKSEYSMPNMNNPLISNQKRVFSNKPPSTYDNKAVTKINNFIPYTNVNCSGSCQTNRDCDNGCACSNAGVPGTSGYCTGGASKGIVRINKY